MNEDRSRWNQLRYVAVLAMVLAGSFAAGASRAEPLPERYRELVVNIGVLLTPIEYERGPDGGERFGYGTGKVAASDPRYSKLGAVGVQLYVRPNGQGSVAFSEIVNAFSSTMEGTTTVPLGDEGVVGSFQKGWVRQYIVRVGDTVVAVGGWGETDPRVVLDPILKRLGGGTLPAGEVAFRNVLFSTGLKFAGDTARSCLDEVMNVAEGDSAKEMAGDLARLHDAASRVHAIQVLAAVPVGPQNFDDFDPKWWDALKEVVPNPTSTPDPQETATDRLIDLLPPPMNTVVNIVRTGSKTMRAIKTHIVDPATHGEIYACYRRQRQLEGAERITEKMGQDALESAAAQVLLDATGASCKYAYNFKTSYEPQLKGFTSPEARHDEFKRLLRPVAVRFEYIYQVEDAKARQQTLIAERWKPVQDILARLKVRVNACIADRAAKPR